MIRHVQIISIILLLCIKNNAYSQISKVNHIIDSCATNGNFNGAVLIAKNGKIKLLKYVGLANRHYNIKFSEKSRFHIFSLTKTFTAVLIMQLYEKGKINLDSTISSYYPEYKGEAAKKATIRDLLTYSSGRENKDTDSPALIRQAYNETIWDLDNFIKNYLSEKLINTPGTKFNYNNGDFIILGKIIEKIYKKSFEKVLNEQILKPLNMHNTGFMHHDSVIKNIDEGYFGDISDVHKLHMPTNYYIDNYYSAGAMYSTPRDLLLFDYAIFNHIILNSFTVDLMLTSYKKLDDVALGFWVYPKKFGTINTIFAERQGDGYGHSANWVHLVDKKLTFILLENTNTVDLNKMREKVISAYLGQ